MGQSLAFSSMKQLLLICAVVALVGCGSEPSNPNSGVSELDMQLLKASKLDDPQVVEDLIKSGANVDTIWTGVERHSALANWLHYGSFSSSEFTWIETPLHNAIIHDRTGNNGVKVARIILDKGADIELNKNREGLTPLHRAVDHSSVAMIELLIKRGAKIDAKNNDGFTPLDTALKIANNSSVIRVDTEPRQQVVELLRKNGAKTAEELKTEGK